MKKLKKKIFQETFWSLLTKGITFVFLFLINVFLARSLGVREYGSWSLFFSWLTIFTTVSYLGINSSSKKFIAQFNHTKSLKGILLSSLKVRIFFSFIFTILLYLLHKPLIGLTAKTDFTDLILIAIPLIFLLGLLEYLRAVFIGLHKIVYKFIINSLYYGFQLIFIAVFFFFFYHKLLLVLYACILAGMISAAVGFYFFYTAFYRKLTGDLKNYTKQILKYSLPFLFINTGFIIITELNTVMLGFLSNHYEVGIFSIAKQVVIKLPHISLAISIGVMPLFAQVNQHNTKKLKIIFYKLLKLNTLIFSTMSLLIIFFARFFVPLLFGKNFSESVLPLQLLTPYLLLYSYSVYLSTFLDYQGRAKKRAINLTVAIILNIFLNFTLIPKYGAVGAAISTSVAYIPYFILNCLEARRVFNYLINKRG